MLSASSLIVEEGDIDLGQPPESEILDWGMNTAAVQVQGEVQVESFSTAH
jgi:hypothetical protein